MRITSGYRRGYINVRGGTAPSSAHLDRIIRTLQTHTGTTKLQCPKDKHSDGTFVRIRREFDSQWRNSFKKDTT